MDDKIVKTIKIKGAMFQAEIIEKDNGYMFRILGANIPKREGVHTSVHTYLTIEDAETRARELLV